MLDSKRIPVAKKNRRKGPYPYYGANGIQDYVDSYIFDGTFLLVGEDGSVIRADKSPVLNWAVGKIWVNNHAHVLSEGQSADLRYLYYALQVLDVSSVVRGTPPKLNQENLKKIELLLPPLAEQKQISAKLDAFMSVVTALDEEIAARREQFAGWLEKLMEFREAA